LQGTVPHAQQLYGALSRLGTSISNVHYGNQEEKQRRYPSPVFVVIVNYDGILDHDEYRQREIDWG
jgi:hypothetical protein